MAANSSKGQLKFSLQNLCFLEMHLVSEKWIWFMVQKTVLVAVKLAVVMFELLDGRSWSATTTQILSLWKTCAFRSFFFFINFQNIIGRCYLLPRTSFWDYMNMWKDLPPIKNGFECRCWVRVIVQVSKISASAETLIQHFGSGRCKKWGIRFHFIMDNSYHNL